MGGGRVDFTPEELSTVLKHEAPGSPKLSILSFKGAFHGRSVGLLSCSNSRPIQGVDIPTLNWPKADFPKYKYPLHENVRENEAEDARCLARVEELIEQATKDGEPVAGVISEPIQAEGGDNLTWLASWLLLLSWQDLAVRRRWLPPLAGLPSTTTKLATSWCKPTPL